MLVCGAETLSRVTDYDDRTTAVLFGDGAGAVVVGPSADGRRASARSSFGTDGRTPTGCGCPAAALRIRRPSRRSTTSCTRVHMNGQDVYKHACDRMTEAARDVIGDRPLDESTSSSRTRRTRASCGRSRSGSASEDEQVVHNIERYGNNSAASIPIALADLVADGRLVPA